MKTLAERQDIMYYNELVHHFDAVQFPYEEPTKFAEHVRALMKNGYTQAQAMRSLTILPITY